MIDENGYRANVGIILADGCGRVFWGRRVGQEAWQFPQGGMAADETEEEAMYRELQEEVGLQPAHVSIIGCTRGWLNYRLPGGLVRRHSDPVCIGQKQKWFLLHLQAGDDVICLDDHDKPEFDGWQWVSYWYPVQQVVSFKREVYRRAMKELSGMHAQLVRNNTC